MRFLVLCSLFLLHACALTAGAASPEARSADPDALVLARERAFGDDFRALGNPSTADAPTAAAKPAEIGQAVSTPVGQGAPDVSGAPRQVIYSGSLRLVVVSAADAVRRVQEFAEQAGGYLQESAADSITVRVPATKFEETLARVAALGEVVARSVRASDVTEEMLDLDIRLANARKTRDRLLEHLAQSTKIEDTLKIEVELSRVTEELERMEGRLRYMQSHIAMSTIQVALNTLGPRDRRAEAGPVTPFEWLGGLGAGLVAGNVEAVPRKPSFFSRGPHFVPPQGFIRYFSRSDLVEALDADGLRLKVQRHDNHDKGEVAFWAKLARRSLVEGRALAVTVEKSLGEHRALIAGTREVAGAPSSYLLVLVRTTDRVTTFEAWGPTAAFDPRFESLVASAKSLTP